ncbi:MAG: tRNA (adenosine(37)-N6)-threonylcarbamoyltransferase complex ATPase subunit type 1 TsaE [Bryobacteraceae bacterium]|nr:tRNA (adenosine(37)-N6)-threonylcarbamoyltransferase complex ATPase subunit type 1 TsaE [Bryobacteraceae bacterium]
MSASVVRTRSEEETIELGRRIAERLPRPAVVLLIGELGSGKTTLAKGIIQGLAAADPEEVSSPTYTLIHEFGDGARVYHIDLYRIDSAAEVLALGLDDLLNSNAVLLVEWGERFPQLWPEDRIEIRLRWLEENTREIEIRGAEEARHGTVRDREQRL